MKTYMKYFLGIISLTIITLIYLSSNMVSAISFQPNWQKEWGAAGLEISSSLCINNNELYAIGTTQASQYGNSDTVLQKYHLDGTLCWNKQWGGSNDDDMRYIDVYGSSIYTAGRMYNSSLSLCDAYVAKFDINGNELWHTSWGDANDDTISSLNVDSSGVYLTGTTEANGNGNYDCLLLKYDYNGNLVWSKTWGGTDYETVNGGTKTPDSIYACGSCTRASSYNGVMIIKFDNNGNLIWNRTWGNSTYVHEGMRVISDQSGIYVCGHSYNPHNFNFVGLLLKYDINGNLIWNRTIQYDEKTELVALNVTENGLYFIATAHNSVDNIIKNYIVNYDKDGDELWNNEWYSPGIEDYPGDIISDLSGFYICGGTRTTGQMYNGFVLKGTSPEFTGYVMSGYVYEKGTTNGINNALLFVSPGNYSIATDESGYYSLVLQDGTYNLTISAEGYVTANDIVAMNGGDASRSFTLDKYIPPVPTKYGLGGHVYKNGTTQAIVNAKITVTPGDYIIYTDGEGYFSIKLPNGTYNVLVEQNDYSDVTTTMTINGGDVQKTIYLIENKQAVTNDVSSIYIPVIAGVIVAIIVAVVILVFLWKRKKKPVGTINQYHPGEYYYPENPAYQQQNQYENG